MRTFVGMLERHAKQSHLLVHKDFSFDHPVEEAGRLFLAASLKHMNLAYPIHCFIERGKQQLKII